MYEANLQLSFPNTTDVDQGNDNMQKLRRRLAKALPDHDVEITKLLRDYAFEDALVLETGNDVAPQDQKFTASLKVMKRAPETEEEAY